jgi:hypothetical protein
MCGLLWVLLSSSTGQFDHPGCMRDYIEAWDFDCNVFKAGPKRFGVDITASREEAVQ